MRCKFVRDVTAVTANDNADQSAFSHRKDGDLAQLSSLGHFLKGSSATLGLTKRRFWRNSTEAKWTMAYRARSRAGRKMAQATDAVGSLAMTLEFTPGQWASLMAMLPIALGVWIASVFAAWHMVLLLLRISLTQGYYGTWEIEDEWWFFWSAKESRATSIGGFLRTISQSIELACQPVQPR